MPKPLAVRGRRKSTDACRDCIFWVATMRVCDDPYREGRKPHHWEGECRAHAPVAGRPRYPSMGHAVGGYSAFMPEFPVTREDFACGDFKESP